MICTGCEVDVENVDAPVAARVPVMLTFCRLDPPVTDTPDPHVTAPLRLVSPVTVHRAIVDVPRLVVPAVRGPRVVCPENDAVWPVTEVSVHDPKTDAFPEVLRVAAASMLTFIVPDTLPDTLVIEDAVRDDVNVAAPLTASVEARDSAPETVDTPANVTVCPEMATAPFEACSSRPAGLL